MTIWNFLPYFCTVTYLPSIHAICKTMTLTQFFCHKHLIQNNFLVNIMNAFFFKIWKVWNSYCLRMFFHKYKYSWVKTSLVCICDWIFLTFMSFTIWKKYFHNVQKEINFWNPRAFDVNFKVYLVKCVRNALDTWLHFKNHILMSHLS